MSDPLHLILRSNPVGLLQREIPVELVNISRSGCLVSSPTAIVPGTLATLSVAIDGETYSDDIQVTRCLAVPGAGERHHVGAQFLAVRTAGQRSLRALAVSLNVGARADALADWQDSAS